MKRFRHNIKPLQFIEVIFLKRKHAIKVSLCIVALIIVAAAVIISFGGDIGVYDVFKKEPEEKTFIRWVNFTPDAELINKAIKYDIDTYGSDVHLNFVELLAYTASKCGGQFTARSSKDMDEFAERLASGEKVSDMTQGMKSYDYYLEAYDAVLCGFVGEYQSEVIDKATGEKYWESGYGLTVFSPIAKGFNYGHYKDFGNERTYGYKRKHEGNDLMGSVGTPIIAIESGIVEEMGWNRFGGWRIGIRSFDNRRYYYYAHMRKDHPYVRSLKEGDIMTAGDVIGYMGLTGYSNTENTNNLQRPHLHLGLQLIFEEIQKEGRNQIWIDVYSIVEVLKANKSAVVKDEESGEYRRVYGFKPEGIQP